MPDITYPYAITDGATLVPDSLNRNLYATASGESAYETGNGNLDAANLAGAFRVKPHMVRPWRMGDGGTEGDVLPLTFFQDAWGRDEEYYPIAGASVTWYQHFDANFALFFGSLFMTQWRQPGPSANDAWWDSGDWVDPAKIQVRCFFDDELTGLPATRRELAPTVFYRDSGPLVEPQLRVMTNEARTAHQFNLMHARRTGGGGDNQYTAKLLAGWRTFGVGVYVSKNLFGDGSSIVEDIVPILNATDPGFFATPAVAGRYYPALHRVKFYVRNATWVALR